MTVAIRLRCTCRRTLATLDHGSDHFELAEREAQSHRPFIVTTSGEVDIASEILGLSFPITAMNDVLIRCTRCHDYRRFSATQLEDAMRRARETGKPADILANDS